MKTQARTLLNESRTSATTGTTSGRKPVLVGLMRFLWAAALGLPALGAQAGVAFSSLHSFGVSTNGNIPNAGLVQGSEGFFYGTTGGGGTYTNYGTVFKISTNGTFTTLYSFTGSSDGANPQARLVQGSDGNFYGTTSGGGTYMDQYGQGYGTVFQISSNGLFTSLYSFGDNGYGRDPNGLVQGSDGNLYGSTWGWGVDRGTVFQITTDGTLTTLYSFTGGSDGARPSTLVQASDGDFYGTTYEGGSQNGGTVFHINTTGALTVLYSFPPNSPLVSPSSLVQGSDGNFYGTTSEGGSKNAGSVFQINSAGDLISLYSFNFGDDGAKPLAGLVLGRDGNFYGTTFGALYGSGVGGLGTVFQISTNGALTTLYFFDGIGGSSPAAGLVQGSDGNLYGTASAGGDYDYGSAFNISTDGAFTLLYSFTGGTDGESPYAGLVQGRDGSFYGTTPINYDNVFSITTAGALTILNNFRDYNQNANPQTLVEGSDGNFYGTLSDTYALYGYEGYYYGNGTVFKMSPAGALTTLHAFDGKNDGANPRAGLVQGSDGNLYGTTSGGTNNAGTVFQISTNGAFTSLYFFTGGKDGATPLAGLVQGSDGYFYGTTSGGGAYTNQYGQTFGTVFRISTNGAFTSLYSFTGGKDGANPRAGLVQGSDGGFYGTTSGGGQGGAGTVFRLTIVPISPPHLILVRSGPNVILTWPTNATDFTLQSTTNLGSSAVWSTNSSVPVVVNGQNVVTNPISGTRQFFRLSQ